MQDANTSPVMTVIDDNWDGVAQGGLGADDTVPFSRTGGGTAVIFVRGTDTNNAYCIRMESGSPNNIFLDDVEKGKASTLTSSTFTGTTATIKIKVNGTRIKTWVDRHRRSATIILQEAWRDPQEEGSAADLVAEARVVAVWIGEGRQPIRVPEEIKKALGDPARR